MRERTLTSVTRYTGPDRRCLPSSNTWRECAEKPIFAIGNDAEPIVACAEHAAGWLSHFIELLCKRARRGEAAI